MDIAAIKAEHSPAHDVATLDFGEFQLKVKRWGNPEFVRAIREAMDRPEVRRKRDLNRLTPEEDRAITDDVIARTVLAGWENIEQGGAPFPYSVENARELLKAEFLRAELVAFSQDEANYRAASLEAGIEALKKSSNGTSPTPPTS